MIHSYLYTINLSDLLFIHLNGHALPWMEWME